jgi:hypothetical protein
MAASGFSDETLAALLAALRIRSANHPESPGLIACWPDVRENRMASGCDELIRRGHVIDRVTIGGTTPGATRTAWAVRGNDPAGEGAVGR